MRNTSHIIVILLLLLNGCSNNREPVTLLKVNGFVLADTTRPATAFLDGASHAGYPIYYIGPLKDTIGIGRQYKIKRPPWHSWFMAHFSRHYSDGNLSIIVDTAARTNAPAEYILESGQILEDSTQNYHACVFTIQNRSDSILYMGSTYDVFYMAREVKNRQGQWIQVEKKLSETGLCTSSRAHVFLRSKEIIISKTRLHRGNFVAETRLVFGYNGNTAWSNVYLDGIDEWPNTPM